MPEVSVITPCYNSEAFVGQTIESVVRQSFQNWEQIVVDDGSTDDSRRVIEGYVRRHARIRLTVQGNRGVSHARNRAFRESSKESTYLLFLDADDCLEPSMLEVLTSYMDVRPEVGLARCEYRFMDAEESLIEHPEPKKNRFVPSGLWVRSLSKDEPDTPFVSVFTFCGIIPSISLIRRSVFEQTPGFDENFGQHHEDLDLFLHIALKGRIHFVPVPLVRRRVHEGQSTSDPTKFLPQEEKLFRKWRQGDGLTDAEKAVVSAAWRFKQGRLEPYLAFQRASNYLRAKQIGKGIRSYFGGLRRYIASFFL